MKKLILAFVFILLASPAFALSYAGELANSNETYDLITSLSFEGNDYSLYGIYQQNQMQLMVIQDSLGNLVISNETIKGIFYAYRKTSSESINSRIVSDKDFILFLSRIQEKKNLVESEIGEIESVTSQFQSLILNLSSQGAYASKSIKLFSDLQSMIWQAKTFLFENRFNSAEKELEDAKKLSPQIFLDARSSLRINEGSLALKNVLAEIDSLRKQGYNTSDIETLFNDANSLLTEAKNSYTNEGYDIDSKISSVLDMANKISYEIEKSNAINPTQKSVPQPTGLAIADYSLVSFLLVIIAAAIVILKARSKKELRGISKLERIKSRLE